MSSYSLKIPRAKTGEERALEKEASSFIYSSRVLSTYYVLGIGAITLIAPDVVSIFMALVIF